MSGTRVSIYCPHCSRYTSVDPVRVEVEVDYQKYYANATWIRAPNELWWMGVCNHCHNPVLVRNGGEIVYPNPLPEPTDPDVPEEIRADLDEAKRCFQAAAWRATAVMARRAIQSAAIRMGASGERLVEQIAELAKEGKITAALKQWADAIRWVGNDAAHPGGEPVTRDDAEAVLGLAEELLRALFVTPERARKLAEKRRR